MTPAAPGLTFDEARHEYRYGGRLVPGVTSVLEFFDHDLQRAKRANPEAFQNAADLGTAVHLACDYYDRGVEIDEATLAPVVGARLEQWKKFRRDKAFVPILVEEKVYHPVYDYAGKLDRLGALDGRRSLLDIKSGAVSRFAQLQTAAYSAAHQAMGGAKVEQRLCVHLDDDRYWLVPHRDPQDATVFVSMVNAWRWLTAGA